MTDQPMEQLQFMASFFVFVAAAVSILLFASMALRVAEKGRRK